MPYTMKKTVIERLLEKVDTNGSCWIWRGAYSSNGYPMMSIRNVGKLATRVIFEELISPIPEGSLVSHECGDKKCVRPSHLCLMTRKENRDLMYRKHRAKPNGKPGLSAGQLQHIITSDMTVEELAHQYNRRPATIARLRRGLHYKIHRDDAPLHA